MKIAVNPQWTFKDAVRSAWEAYGGGQQYGATNRIRLLEQWANVVGRDRATSELKDTLHRYESVEAAGEALGLSTYAIRKLRRKFASMPAVTPHSSAPLSFCEFLRHLPELIYDRQISAISQAVPNLANYLGYASSEIYLESSVTGHPGYRIDAVFAPAGVSDPYIIVEIKWYTSGITHMESAIDQAEYIRRTVQAPFGMVLTPRHLAILSDTRQDVYSLSNLTEDEADTIQCTLRRPEMVRPRYPKLATPAGTHLQNMLAAVAAAQTNDEKRKTLEDLAAAVFDSHPHIKCKYRNLRTRSSEIDIVCEISGTEVDIPLREYGRYFLVECKNWAVPAGAKEIRDFLGKLGKSRVRLGVYFSRNGITGEHNGTDALREISSAYDKDEIYVVVISEQDLSPLRNMSDVFDTIEEKLNALRFDF